MKVSKHCNSFLLSIVVDVGRFNSTGDLMGDTAPYEDLLTAIKQDNEEGEEEEEGWSKLVQVLLLHQQQQQYSTPICNNHLQSHQPYQQQQQQQQQDIKSYTLGTHFNQSTRN